MAEAIVSVVTEEFLEKLISLASEEINLASGFKVEVRKLKDLLESIQAVLEDAEKQQVKKKPVNIWLKRLKDVAYDADDILDEIATEHLLRKMETESRLMKKVRNFFSPSNPIAFRFKMAHKIKGINDKLDEITKDKDRFQFCERVANESTPKKREGRETHSFLDKDSPIVGRDDDVSNVVNMLINSPDQEKISVLPIVGLGRLGKTTLARLVYNDESIKNYFDKRIWVCVSDDLDVTRLMKEINESITGNKCELTNLDTAGRNFQDKLKGKSFLLVLDDVWNEEIDKWISLKSSLDNGGSAGRGSKIFVTTRNDNVATIMGTLPKHCLKGLSNEECWSIFKQRAFEKGVEEDPILVEIGKEIVEKCGGLPLAAQSLGSLMSSSWDVAYWENVRKSEIWNLPENDNNKILSALKLSYDHLPSHLKQCFAYCAIFPKDFKIEKELLIKLWMAEGFVQLPQGSDWMLEDIATDYFNSLWRMSFFQDIEKNKYGDVEKCKMHDLVHDLAQSIDGNECLIIDHDGKVHGDHDRIRHLSFVTDMMQKFVGILDIIDKSSLHTLLVLDNIFYMREFPKEKKLPFKNLRCAGFEKDL